MNRRLTLSRRKLIGVAAAGALLMLALVFGPLLETYRQFTYPLVPGWQHLQVVYLAAPGAAPLPAGLHAQTFTDPQAVITHAQTYGLDVLIVTADTAAGLDLAWTHKQYEQGTALVGLDITPTALSLISGDGLLSTLSHAEYASPYVTATSARLGAYPNVFPWLSTQPPHLPSLRELFGSETEINRLVNLYTPTGGDLLHALEPLRLRFDWLHLARP